jgi:IS5 family transposase
MGKPRDDRSEDLFHPALEEIIDTGHMLVRLANEIDWSFLDQRFSAVCQPGPGPPLLPTRLVAGLLILKHTHNLSDEVLCARSLENPHYQYFCGEEMFCHQLPFDRTSLTRWRQRLGRQRITNRLCRQSQIARNRRQTALSCGFDYFLSAASPLSTQLSDSSRTANFAFNSA